MKITVRDNASLKIEVGDGETLEIVDAAGRTFGLDGRTTVSLCRCGHSANKPFCDSSHNRCGFDSAVEAFDLPPRRPA